MQLQNKVAVITGSTAGIGEFSARLFVREGAKVVISGRTDSSGERIVKEIREQGGEATFVRADAGVVKDMENLIHEAVKTYGRLDIFWHNAGVFLPGHIDLVKEKDFDQVVATTLKGAVFGTQFAIREMRKVGGGSILFTSSMVGLRPSPYSPQYSLMHSVAKASLIALMRSLVEPLAKDNIRVNCLCPGPVRTPHFDATQKQRAETENVPLEEVYRRSSERIPLKRVITMEEVAEAALFLCSDNASSITEVALPIDGGFAAV